MAKFQELAEFARLRSAPLDGLLQSYLAMDETGKGVMVGVWASREQAQASFDEVKANWDAVSEHLDGEPQMDEYPIALRIVGD
jgi:hypothetical protein